VPFSSENGQEYNSEHGPAEVSHSPHENRAGDNRYLNGRKRFRTMTSSWFALQIRIRMELRVSTMLRAKGYEEFLPLQSPSAPTRPISECTLRTLLHLRKRQSSNRSRTSQTISGLTEPGPRIIQSGSQCLDPAFSFCAPLLM
jgi:hypothetical protein